MKNPTAAGLANGLDTDLLVDCEIVGDVGTLHFHDGDMPVAEMFQCRLEPDGSVKWVGGQVLQEGYGLYAAFLKLTQPGGYLSKLGRGPSTIPGNAPEAGFYIDTCFDVTATDDNGDPTVLTQNEQRTADWLEVHT